MKKRELSSQLLPREITWGTRYLLFQLAFLGALIKLLLGWLWPGYSAVWLDTIYYGINLAAAIWIFRHFISQSLCHAIKHLPLIIIVSFIALIVYFAVVPPLETAIETLKPDFVNQNNSYVIQKAATNQWLNTFGIIALVPFAEEIWYRGLLFGAIRKKNRALAYVVSVLVFAAIHIIPYWGMYTLPVFLLSFAVYIPAGLILALAYELSDNIFAPVLIHTTINTIAMLI